MAKLWECVQPASAAHHEALKKPGVVGIGLAFVGVPAQGTVKISRDGLLAAVVAEVGRSAEARTLKALSGELDRLKRELKGVEKEAADADAVWLRLAGGVTKLHREQEAETRIAALGEQRLLSQRKRDSLEQEKPAPAPDWADQRAKTAAAQALEQWQQEVDAARGRVDELSKEIGEHAADLQKLREQPDDPIPTAETIWKASQGRDAALRKAAELKAKIETAQPFLDRARERVGNLLNGALGRLARAAEQGLVQQAAEARNAVVESASRALGILAEVEAREREVADIFGQGTYLPVLMKMLLSGDQQG